MTDRKKLALCLEYPLALRGGVSVLVENLLCGLQGHYDLVLVSPDAPEALAVSPAGSLIAHHLRWDPARVSRATAKQLANQLAGLEVDLAHFHLGGNFGWGNRFPGQCPILYLGGLGISACSTVHSVTTVLDGYCGPQRSLWLKLALLPFAWLGKMTVLWHLHSEIAVSRHNLAKLKGWYWPLQGRFVQIYHSRIKKGSSPGQGRRERFILNVGHLARRKGQTLLAEAFAKIAPRHPDWKLWLVGDAVEEGVEREIRGMARTYGLEDRIILAGRRADTFDLMNRAAIYVQPSHEEALGLALQEAMFCGCPSIGASVGGIPELIQHEETGLLTPAGDSSQLAQAIEMLISNPILRDQYGRQGNASIIQKEMTAEHMLASHRQLYESMLQDS